MGGNRPPPKEGELFKRYRNLLSQPKESPQAPQYISIYEKAKAKKHRIYGPRLSVGNHLKSLQS